MIDSLWFPVLICSVEPFVSCIIRNPRKDLSKITILPQFEYEILKSNLVEGF